MERFVIIVNGFQPLTIITKRLILDDATAPDPPLEFANIFETLCCLLNDCKLGWPAVANLIKTRRITHGNFNINLTFN